MPDIGRRLGSIYYAAGLPLPSVEAVIPVASGPESPVLDWIASSLRSIEPVLERIGAALPAGLDFASLAGQWQKAIVADGVQLEGPVQYGAWARIP